MRLIRPGFAIIAELIILGVEKVSYRDLNAIKSRLMAAWPIDFQFDLSETHVENDALVYEPNSREREETYDIFVRGWCAKTHVEILKIIEKNLKFSPFYQELVDKLDELDLAAIHAKVFSQEYVNDHCFLEIPNDYQDSFIQICQEYVKNLPPDRLLPSQ